MKAFIYNGKTYIRLIPGKMLFRSTMIHEVVNRGDIFGMDIETQVFTIVPGTAKVEHITLSAVKNTLSPTAALTKKSLDLFSNIILTHDT